MISVSFEADFGVFSYYFFNHVCLSHIDKPDMVNFATPTLKPVNGDQVVFTCTSNGLPAPSFRIHRINGTDDTVVQDNTSNTYTIPSINYVDYIDYKVTFKCVPYNRLGDGPSKNHTLDIQGKFLVCLL